MKIVSYHLYEVLWFNLLAYFEALPKSEEINMVNDYLERC